MVFGRVLSGFEDVFKTIEDTPKGPNDKPLQDVVIVNCGELTEPVVGEAAVAGEEKESVAAEETIPAEVVSSEDA